MPRTGLVTEGPSRHRLGSLAADRPTPYICLYIQIYIQGSRFKPCALALCVGLCCASCWPSLLQAGCSYFGRLWASSCYSQSFGGFLAIAAAVLAMVACATGWWATVCRTWVGHARSVSFCFRAACGWRTRFCVRRRLVSRFCVVSLSGGPCHATRAQRGWIWYPLRRFRAGMLFASGPAPPRARALNLVERTTLIDLKVLRPLPSGEACQPLPLIF